MNPPYSSRFPPVSVVESPLAVIPPACRCGQAMITLQPRLAASTAAATPPGVEPYTSTSTLAFDSGATAAKECATPWQSGCDSIVNAVVLRKCLRFMCQEF